VGVSKYTGLGRLIGYVAFDILAPKFLPHNGERYMDEINPGNLYKLTEWPDIPTIARERLIEPNGHVTVQFWLTVCGPEGPVLVVPVSMQNRDGTDAQLSMEAAQALIEGFKVLVEGGPITVWQRARRFMRGQTVEASPIPNGNNSIWSRLKRMAGYP
jgi:hypothetical protein